MEQFFKLKQKKQCCVPIHLTLLDYGCALKQFLLGKNVLKRLKDKQTEHIENLINTYGLKNTNKVKKSVMEKMLEEAIHL